MDLEFTAKMIDDYYNGPTKWINKIEAYNFLIRHIRNNQWPWFNRGKRKLKHAANHIWNN